MGRQELYLLSCAVDNLATLVFFVCPVLVESISASYDSGVNLQFHLDSSPASPRGFFSGILLTSNTSLPLLLRQPVIDFSASSYGRVLSSPVELGYSGLTVGLVGVVDVQRPFVSADAGSNLILNPFMGHGVGILQTRYRMEGYAS
jgi:hypothetical protein